MQYFSPFNSIHLIQFHVYHCVQKHRKSGFMWLYLMLISGEHWTSLDEKIYPLAALANTRQWELGDAVFRKCQSTLSFFCAECSWEGVPFACPFVDNGEPFWWSFCRETRCFLYVLWERDTRTQCYFEDNHKKIIKHRYIITEHVFPSNTHDCYQTQLLIYLNTFRYWRTTYLYSLAMIWIHFLSYF